MISKWYKYPFIIPQYTKHHNLVKGTSKNSCDLKLKRKCYVKLLLVYNINVILLLLESYDKNYIGSSHNYKFILINNTS